MSPRAIEKTTRTSLTDLNNTGLFKVRTNLQKQPREIKARIFIKRWASNCAAVSGDPTTLVSRRIIVASWIMRWDNQMAVRPAGLAIGEHRPSQRHVRHILMPPDGVSKRKRHIYLSVERER
jgi:hypothetical protein